MFCRPAAQGGDEASGITVLEGLRCVRGGLDWTLGRSSSWKGVVKQGSGGVPWLTQQATSSTSYVQLLPMWRINLLLHLAMLTSISPTTSCYPAMHAVWSDSRPDNGHGQCITTAWRKDTAAARSVHREISSPATSQPPILPKACGNLIPTETQSKHFVYRAWVREETHCSVWDMGVRSPGSCKKMVQ